MKILERIVMRASLATLALMIATNTTASHPPTIIEVPRQCQENRMNHDILHRLPVTYTRVTKIDILKEKRVPGAPEWNRYGDQVDLSLYQSRFPYHIGSVVPGSERLRDLHRLTDLGFQPSYSEMLFFELAPDPAPLGSAWSVYSSLYLGETTEAYRRAHPYLISPENAIPVLHFVAPTDRGTDRLAYDSRILRYGGVHRNEFHDGGETSVYHQMIFYINPPPPTRQQLDDIIADPIE